MSDIQLIIALLPPEMQNLRNLEKLVLDSQKDPRYQWLTEKPQITLDDVLDIADFGLSLTPVIGDSISIYNAVNEFIKIALYLEHRDKAFVCFIFHLF